MKIVISLLSVLILLSCSSSTSSPDTEDTAETIIAEPIVNASSTFSIEGMTCEIGCVRTVKSHLSKMEGVIDISMNFDTSRTTDFSTVKYDQRLVSESDMKAEIESIANGIYTVTEVNPENL